MQYVLFAFRDIFVTFSGYTSINRPSNKEFITWIDFDNGRGSFFNSISVLANQTRTCGKVSPVFAVCVVSPSPCVPKIFINLVKYLYSSKPVLTCIQSLYCIWLQYNNCNWLLGKGGSLSFMMWILLWRPIVPFGCCWSLSTWTGRPSSFLSARPAVQVYFRMNLIQWSVLQALCNISEQRSYVNYGVIFLKFSQCGSLNRSSKSSFFHCCSLFPVFLIFSLSSPFIWVYRFFLSL